MKRLILFKNGAVVGSFISERAARLRFLQVCSSCDFREDEIRLIDLEDDGATVAVF